MKKKVRLRCSEGFAKMPVLGIMHTNQVVMISGARPGLSDREWVFSQMALWRGNGREICEDGCSAGK